MSRVATDHIWRLVCRGVLVFASLVAVASPMATAGSSEYIASFDVHYLLAKSGKLTVEETIAYEFGSNVRHGIYRDIPTQYRDDKNNYFYTTVEVGGVYDGAGAPVHYTEGTTSSGLQIRIGDAAVTVTGEHIYKINYSIQPIVRPGDSGDRLALNVNGTSWQVPVQHATASLSLADGLVASSVRCYTGAMGSTETACSAV